MIKPFLLLGLIVVGALIFALTLPIAERWPAVRREVGRAILWAAVFLLIASLAAGWPPLRLR